MAAIKRTPTKYPGVSYREAKRVGGPGVERVYYVRWKTPDGKTLEEKVGRQYKDDMTPAKAAIVRADYIEGRRLPKRDQKAQEETKRREEEVRQMEEAARQQAEENRPVLSRLWSEFRTAKADIKSLNSEEGRWNLHIAPFIAHKEPCELLTLDIDRINRSMIDKGLSKQTRKHCLVLIKRIIAYAVDMGRIKFPYSPTFKINLKKQIGKVNNETTEDLDPEQLQRLLKAIQEAPAQDRQGADCMRLALCTGMRKSEIYKLRWDEVSFDRGNIRITAPKGGEDVTIPLNSSARAILEGIPRQSESPWIFPGRDPKTHVSCLKRQINRIRRAAQLPEGFRPMHGLRHAYACSLISSGKVDIPTLQKLLTHKSPEMTLRYAKVRDERLSNAAGVMDEILCKTQGDQQK
jgi:integrase